jgi:hypothetical protein
VGKLQGKIHRRHSLERGRDDRPHDAFAHPRIHDRRRRIGVEGHEPRAGGGDHLLLAGLDRLGSK